MLPSSFLIPSPPLSMNWHGCIMCILLHQRWPTEIWKFIHARQMDKWNKHGSFSWYNPSTISRSSGESIESSSNFCCTSWKHFKIKSLDFPYFHLDDIQDDLVWYNFEAIKHVLYLSCLVVVSRKKCLCFVWYFPSNVKNLISSFRLHF